MTFKIWLLIAYYTGIYAIIIVISIMPIQYTLPEGTRNLNFVFGDLYCCEPVRQCGILFQNLVSEALLLHIQCVKTGNKLREYTV